MERGYGRPEAAPADVSAEFAAKDERQGGALRRSAVVLCVSNAMRDEIAARWSIAPERVHVVPCCTDVEAGRLAAQRRDATRKRLGLERRFVVAYCGSAAPWQMLRESLAVYRRIRALRNDAHFLAITTGVTAVATAAEAACLPPAEHTIMSVPHADVADVLAAADVGLLIRDRSVVNRVASPVKFAEYLSCGVPVVLTEGIGDFSKLVRDLGLGSVLPDAGRRDSAVDDVESFMRSFATEAAGRRERCMAAARSHLSWATMIEVVSRTYEELAGACPFDTCSSLMAEPQARC
jgi:glycosyltransferase involved in cell wall biosynthesis